MSLLKTFLLSTSIIFTSAHAQVKTNTAFPPVSSKPIPIIIRKDKPIDINLASPNPLVSEYFRSIFQDSKGNLWFGSLGEGVIKYDTKTLQYFTKADGFITRSVQAITEDQQGNLWFGTDNGLYKYDRTSFRNYNQQDGLSVIDISRKALVVDKAGTLWAGTQGGVFRYNPAADTAGGKSFSLFDALPRLNIAGIMEDEAGNIWFATSSSGVFRYDPSQPQGQANAILHLTQKEALGQNYAGGMAQDKAGNMWFTFKDGICKYNGQGFTEYTAKDGLGGTEFWGICIEASGIIWVTARGATTRFDPSIPLPNPAAFKVFTPADGLNCCVQTMYQDQQGNMWWGTGQGLYRFDGKRFYQVKKDGPW